MRHSPVGSVECKFHAAPCEIDRRCKHKSPLRKVPSSPEESQAVPTQPFGNNRIDVCYFQSKHPFVDSEAARQNIHEREDAPLVDQDYASLPHRGVELFLIGQELLAT